MERMKKKKTQKIKTYILNDDQAIEGAHFGKKGNIEACVFLMF